MKNNIMKKFLATTTATLILISCSGFLNVIASEIEMQAIAEAKISNELKTRMRTQSNEGIPVTIWTGDIDMETIQEKALSNARVSQAPAIVRSMSEDIPVHDLSYLQAYGTDDEIQNYIEDKRAKARIAYSEQNQKFLNQLPIGAKVTFVSEYSPLIEVTLSNNEIYNLAKKNEVYSISLDKPENNEPELNISVPAIGADYVRDTQGNKGSGVKVGLLEANGVPNTSNSQIRGTWTKRSGDPVDSAHATRVAIIISQIAPSATYYAASATGDSCRPAIEWLLNQGVNVINASMKIGSDSNNSYGDFSKWIDHIAFSHDVHFVKSAGNSGSDGVTSGGMGYNMITVGNMNDHNSTTPSQWNHFGGFWNSSTGKYDGASSYYTGTSAARKPDLCAPGTGIFASSFGETSSKVDAVNTGTSFAAPHVTGAIAQLCSFKSALKTQQDAMKVLLATGTNKDKRYVNGDPSNYEKMGAGMLDVRGTRWMISTGRYHSDLFTPSISVGTTRTYSVTVTSSDTSIRVGLSYLRKMVGGCSSTLPTTQGYLGNLELTVSGPGIDIYSTTSEHHNTKIVQINNPTPGTYTIKVKLTKQSNQNIPYAIAWR